MKKIWDKTQFYNLRKLVLLLWRNNTVCLKSIEALKNNPFAYSDNSVLLLIYFLTNKTLSTKKDFFSRIKHRVKENYQTDANNTEFYRTMAEELNVINSLVSFKTKELFLVEPPSNMKQLYKLYDDSYQNLQKSLGENIKCI